MNVVHVVLRGDNLMLHRDRSDLIVIPIPQVHIHAHTASKPKLLGPQSKD